MSERQSDTRAYREGLDAHITREEPFGKDTNYYTLVVGEHRLEVSSEDAQGILDGYTWHGATPTRIDLTTPREGHADIYLEIEHA